MIGINITEDKYWIAYNSDKSIKKSGYSPTGSQTSFPSLVTSEFSPELFDTKEAWISRCDALGINVPEKYLDE